MRKKFLKRFAALALSVVMIGTSVVTGTDASTDGTVYESDASYATESVTDAEKADAQAGDETKPQASVAPSETPEAAVQTSMPKDTETPSESTEDAAEAADPAAEAKETRKPAATATPKPEATGKSEATEAPAIKAEDVTAIQDYIKQNIDTRYANVDQFVEMDILLIKQTLVDGSALAGGLTIDNLWRSEKNAEAFLKMDQVYMYLYDVDKDSDYFVALADTMHNDDTCTVTDYAFAYTNLRGEEARDCIYDKKTGLAYVPKRYTVENKNELGAMNIQLQLLQTCRTDEPTTDVKVDVDSEVKGKVAESGSATVDAMAFSTDIKLAEDKKARSNIKEDKISVAVNDVETDKFNYDEDTGVLTVAIPPTTIETLDVAVEKETFMEKVAGVLSDIKAAAASLFVTKADAVTASAAVNWNALSDSPMFTFSVDPSVGTVIEIGCDLYYSGTSYNVTNTYGLAESGSGTAQEKVMWNVIQGNQADSGYNYVVIDSKKNDLYFIAQFGTATSAKVTTGSGTVALTGVKADAILACAHVTNTWGHAGAWIQDQPDNTLSTSIRVKVLATGSDSKGAFMVAGIYTKADGTAGGDGQTGVGFVKMYYKVTPQTTEHKVVKKWTYPAKSPKYGTIYGTKPSIPQSVDVVLLRDGTIAAGSTRTLNAGNKWSYTYTGQPIKTETGKTIRYTADESASSKAANPGWTSSVSTSGGTTSITTVTNTAKYGFLRVKKRVVEDPDSGYTGAGAEYGVYYSKSDADNKRNLITTLTTTSTPHAVSGEPNTYDYYSQAVPVWPGTYYVKELSSPPGYLLDKTAHAVIVDAAKHCAAHDGAATLVQTAASTDDQKPGRIKLYKESKELPEGTYFDKIAYSSMYGVKYGVYTDADCKSKDRVDEITVNEYAYEDANGMDVFYGVSDDLPLGTYYVQEILSSVPDGLDWDDTAYKVVLEDDGKTEDVEVEFVAKDYLKTARVQLQKEPAEDAAEEAAKKNLSLKGATYAMYYGSTWDSAKSKGAIGSPYKTDEDGVFTTAPLTLTKKGSNASYNAYYYFKETSPSSIYFGLDPDIYRIQLTNNVTNGSYADYTVWSSPDDGATWKVQDSGSLLTEYDRAYDAWVAGYVSFVSKEPLDDTTVYLHLQKEAEDPDAANGISLAGAAYDVWIKDEWDGNDDIHSAFANDCIMGEDGSFELPVNYLQDLKTGYGSAKYIYVVEDKIPTSSSAFKKDPLFYRISVSVNDRQATYTVDAAPVEYISANEKAGDVIPWETCSHDGAALQDVTAPNNIVTFYSIEPLDTPTIRLKKVPENAGDPVEGAAYKVYEANTAEKLADVFRRSGTAYTTGADGTFTTVSLPLLPKGKCYYIRETKAPAGYALDKSIWRITMDSHGYMVDAVTPEDGDLSKAAGSLVWEERDDCSVRRKNGALQIQITSTEPRLNPVPVRLAKESSMPEVSGNGYDLSGAVYTMYKGTSWINATGLDGDGYGDGEWQMAIEDAGYWMDALYGGTDYTTEKMTDADGNTVYGFVTEEFPVAELENGDPVYYYFIETSAPDGYFLDETVYRVRITGGDGTKVRYRIDRSDQPIGEWDGETTVVVESNQTEGIDVGEPVTFTSKEEPEHYKVGFEKKSATPEVTDADPEKYSLAGAVYAMYAGADNAGTPDWTAVDADNPLDTFATNDFGLFTTGTVPYDTTSWYFFKETEAPENFGLDKNIYAIRATGRNGKTKQVRYETMTSADDGKTWIRGKSGAVENGGLISFTSVEPLKGNVKLRLAKISANGSLTEGNDCYSLKDAEYTLYRGSTFDEAVKKDPVLVLKTDENGIFETDETNGLMLPADGEYYYLTETKASKGYELDPTVWKLNVFYDASGSVAYILSHTTKDEDGNYETDESAWEIDGEATGPVVLGENDYVVVTSKEEPLNDPFGLQLSKLDADTADGSAQGIASLGGAIFELSYYDNTEGTATETATKKWYFETKEKEATDEPDENDKIGYLNCGNADYYIESRPFKGKILVSNELFKDEDGKIVYPMGTYVMKEISEPRYYRLEGEMHLDGIAAGASVTDGLTYVLKPDPDTGKMKLFDKNGVPASGAEIDVGNEGSLDLKVREKVVDNGTIKVIKNEANSNVPIKNVEFRLVGVEDDSVVLTGKTDDNGEIVFKDLIPQHYVLTEIGTVDGKTLLEDNIEITLPLTMTEKEIEALGADIDAAKFDEATGEYCYYDLTYTIGNGTNISVPMTGMDNTPKVYIPLFCGFGLAGIASAVAFKKKKKKA